MNPDRYQRPWRDYASATAVIVIPTIVARLSGLTLGRGFDALVLAVLVGVAARLWGSGPGLVAAGLAFVSFGVLGSPFLFYLHPDTATEWVDTLVFGGAVIFLAVQVGLLRDREMEATVAGREEATLSRVAALLVPDARFEDVGGEVVSAIADVTGAACVTLMLPDDHGNLAAASQFAQEGACAEVVTGRVVTYVWEHAVAVGLPEGGPGPREAGRWPESVAASTIVGPRYARRDIALPLTGSEGLVQGVLYVGPRADGRPHRAAIVGRIVLTTRLLAVFLERHRLQGDAARAQATAEAEQLRANLVSSVSHELKTPLASINATVTGLLDETEPSAERVRLELTSVAGDVARLNRSINDLLDLSRLETEEWRPVKDWQDLGDVVGSVVADLPDRDRVRIVVDLPEEPVVAEVDFVQMSRAVYHLVENALAYSPADTRVVVAVSDPGGVPRITVTDSGPGVLESERHRVFEKFYRGSASAAVPHGTGLGLSIASEVVDRHGGRLSAEPARPKGARFVLELPGDVAHKATPPNGEDEGYE